MLETVAGGLITGIFYALLASGFALVFGVTRIFNLAHGDLVVLGGYVGERLWHGRGISPLLAMAVATQPALLLIDEVLAGQSPTAAQEILAYLARLRAQGSAICLVEHRLQALLAVADRAVALHQGRVIAEGRPGAVTKSPVVLEAYLGEPGR